MPRWNGPRKDCLSLETCAILPNGLVAMSIRWLQLRLLWGLLAAVAVNPTITKAQYTDSECLTLLKQRNQAMPSITSTGKGSYKKMISLARRYLTYCREGMTVDDYADALAALAFALNGDNQNGEALAVANRCLQVNPTNLECSYEKASSLYGLGRIPEAKETLQRALSLPAISESDVKITRNIRELLADVIADINKGPNSPPADRPQQPQGKDGERYGTGFYVTAAPSNLKPSGSSCEARQRTRTVNNNDGPLARILKSRPANLRLDLSWSTTPTVAQRS
jgi:tetratricopeptide (TPR) repeat protein